MADSMTRPRAVPPSSIRALVERGQQAAASQAETPGQDGTISERDDPLPRPGDAYRVHSRHGNKPELTMHFVLKGFAYEGFSYADFERVRLVPGDKPGGGPVLIVRFSGSVVTDVRIEGRHLHSLYHWIGLHGVSWVWEHPGHADFADEAEPIIKRITFQEAQR